MPWLSGTDIDCGAECLRKLSRETVSYHTFRSTFVCVYHHDEQGIFRKRKSGGFSSFSYWVVNRAWNSWQSLCVFQTKPNTCRSYSLHNHIYMITILLRKTSVFLQTHLFYECQLMFVCNLTREIQEFLLVL